MTSFSLQRHCGTVEKSWHYSVLPERTSRILFRFNILHSNVKHSHWDSGIYFACARFAMSIYEILDTSNACTVYISLCALFRQDVTVDLISSNYFDISYLKRVTKIETILSVWRGFFLFLFAHETLPLFPQNEITFLSCLVPPSNISGPTGRSAFPFFFFLKLERNPESEITQSQLGSRRGWRLSLFRSAVDLHKISGHRNHPTFRETHFGIW